MKTHGRHCQHCDLSQRIETAKVDENDVDDVGAAAAWYGIGEMVAGYGVERAREHRIDESG